MECQMQLIRSLTILLGDDGGDLRMQLWKTESWELLSWLLYTIGVRDLAESESGRK
jgi:hypothetical protein